jgi:hypothetical protein
LLRVTDRLVHLIPAKTAKKFVLKLLPCQSREPASATLSTPFKLTFLSAVLLFLQLHPVLLGSRYLALPKN